MGGCTSVLRSSMALYPATDSISVEDATGGVQAATSNPLTLSLRVNQLPIDDIEWVKQRFESVCKGCSSLSSTVRYFIAVLCLLAHDSLTSPFTASSVVACHDHIP